MSRGTKGSLTQMWVSVRIQTEERRDTKRFTNDKDLGKCRDTNRGVSKDTKKFTHTDMGNCRNVNRDTKRFSYEYLGKCRNTDRGVSRDIKRFSYKYLGKCRNTDRSV